MFFWRGSRVEEFATRAFGIWGVGVRTLGLIVWGSGVLESF